MQTAVTFGISVGIMIVMLSWGMHYAKHHRLYSKVVLGSLSIFFSMFAGEYIAERAPAYNTAYIVTISVTVLLAVACLVLFREQMARLDALID